MTRTKRIKETAAGAAYYHVISRPNNKVFLFDSAKIKDALVDTLKRAAAFSGVEIEAYAIRRNHVHAVVKVMRIGFGNSWAQRADAPLDFCGGMMNTMHQNDSQGGAEYVNHHHPCGRLSCRCRQRIR